jgi:hypothetical protein
MQTPLPYLRYIGLSEIINHLLSTSVITPFDFLVYNNSSSRASSCLFLRTSLDAHIKKHALSTEDVIKIEYMPMLNKPELKSNNNEPDWISSINCNLEEYVVYFSPHPLSSSHTFHVLQSLHHWVVRRKCEMLLRIHCIQSVARHI